MRNLIRRTLLPGVVVAFAVATLAAPASAIPIADPGESVTYTYYANAAKTTVVGGWSYGYCGEPFQWGTKTNYFTLRYVNCM
jgi:hypothetical protein